LTSTDSEEKMADRWLGLLVSFVAVLVLSERSFAADEDGQIDLTCAKRPGTGNDVPNGYVVKKVNSCATSDFAI
jgi:hypothetical protein